MTLAVRLGDALRRLAPDTNRSGWLAEHADLLGVGERTFQEWFYGKAEPGGQRLLDLFDHFGADFELEVRGVVVKREMTDAEKLDKAIDLVTEVKRGLKGAS